MKLTRILIGALSASLLLLSLMALAPTTAHHAGGATWMATWINHPRSLDEARQLASSIVVARVSEVTQADDIVVEAPGEPQGVDRLPTQRVTFEVLNTIKGDSAPALSVFRTGTDEKYVEGDPAYTVGETYLLFVEPKADEPGTYRVIAPEGRFRVNNGTIEPMVGEGFAGELRGKPLVEVIATLAGDS